ncbi:hypothetical protein FBY28_3619 [Arthrobacter sp. SLBN-53]|nr:hypothetical protein FBY28_3619 [Arthrobacter sp. SLBN-53]
MTLVWIALTVLAIASVFASRQLIAEAWSPGARAQAFSAQIIVTGGTFSATTLIGSRELLQAATLAGFVASLLLSELSGSKRPHPERRSSAPIMNGTPAGLILAFWAWLFCVNIWMADDETAYSALSRIVSGIALAAFVITQRYRPITAAQFFSAALTTTTFVVVTVPLTPGAFIPCGKFKCTDFDAILQGPFESGNLLGLMAAISGALLLATCSISKKSMVTMVFLFAILYATMSRTSSLALGAGVALMAFNRFLSMPKRSYRASPLSITLVALSVSVLPIAIGMALVFRAQLSDFSNRGRIWILGREAVSGYAASGRGIDWWDALTHAGYFGKTFDRFPHSEYLLIYFSGGLIGLALFAVVMFRVTASAIENYRSTARGAVVPLVFAVCGIIEAIWNPLTIDAGTWLFFALVSVCVGTAGRNVPEETSQPRAGTSWMPKQTRCASEGRVVHDDSPLLYSNDHERRSPAGELAQDGQPEHRA